MANRFQFCLINRGYQELRENRILVWLGGTECHGIEKGAATSMPWDRARICEAQYLYYLIKICDHMDRLPGNWKGPVQWKDLQFSFLENLPLFEPSIFLL